MFNPPREGGSVRWSAVLLLLAAGPPLSATAQESVEPPSAAGLADILDAHRRRTFQAVRQYVADHPQADDAEQAHEWLLTTAWEQGLEPEAVPVAGEVLGRAEAPEPLRRLALKVRSLGQARSGHLDKALADFDAFLQTRRRRAPDDALELAHRLAAQAQLAGSVEAARAVYERLQRAFFLNPEVRRIAEGRLEKLGLVGRPAPEITVDDLAGTRVDLADSAGRVVLLDFWATNCPPCLKQFPELKRLYRTLHPQGLEIVGISLDERPETVAAFQQTSPLPWRLALSGTDRDATRGRYRVQTIPATFLIDRSGRIAYVDLQGPALRQAVERLLAQEE